MVAPRLRTTTPFDIGNPDAPVGSPAWCLAVHTSMCRLKHSAESTVAELQVSLTNFQQRHYFIQLADRDGVPFATWEDFIQYPEPYGLGMRADVVAAIMTERDKRRLVRDVAEATALARREAVERKPGRPKKNLDIKVLSFGGTGASYRLRRLARLKPDVLAAYERGEFPSVDAAFRHAFALNDLRRAWACASPEDRETFIREVAE